MPRSEPLSTSQVAAAIGEAGATPRRLRELARIGVLRQAIIAKAFALDPRLTPAGLRKALACGRAHEASAQKPLRAAEERALAGTLLGGPPPRSDHDLLARLAASLVGAPATDAVTLRSYLLRNGVRKSSPAVEPSLGTARPALQLPALAEFARQIRRLAEPVSSGWAGNRRAYISHVWRSVAETHPGWGLDERSFKSMLAEAHRSGHIQLANADLRDRAHMADVEASATAYKNTIWHFIRVEDE